MKLQRTTWILVALALGLGGFVYFYEFQGASQRETEQVQQKSLFEFEEDEIQGLKIERGNQTLVFERTGKEPSPWQMKQPKNKPASDPTVEFLLNLLVEKERDRAFNITATQLKDYGLEPPLATIAVRLKDQSHQLVLGKPNFEEKLLYAQIDPPPKNSEDLEVVLVSIDFKSAIERQLSEWIANEESKEDKEKEKE